MAVTKIPVDSHLTKPELLQLLTMKLGGEYTIHEYKFGLVLQKSKWIGASIVLKDRGSHGRWMYVRGMIPSHVYRVMSIFCLGLIPLAYIEYGPGKRFAQRISGPIKSMLDKDSPWQA